MVDGTGIAGSAVPVRVRERRGSGDMRTGLRKAIGAAAPGSVLVISSDSDEYSVWGGLTSWHAVKARLQGVVVDGCVRDVEEIRALGLPVFARSRSPISGYGRLEVTGIGEPVDVRGVTVGLGDLVVADSDGVVFVQKKRAEAVMRAVLDAAASEAKEKRRGLSRRKGSEGAA